MEVTIGLNIGFWGKAPGNPISKQKDFPAQSSRLRPEAQGC